VLGVLKIEKDGLSCASIFKGQRALIGVYQMNFK
jgi:hypothetical protein